MPAIARFLFPLALATALVQAADPPREVPGIIFDSDMSSDHDDVGDIATLHGLASLGECRILAMMVSSRNGGTALCMDAINTWYGHPGIPIGVPPDIGGIGEYAGQIAAEFPHALKSPQDCPHAADLYRQILAAAPDHGVTIVTTGFLTNLKALLQSGPDARSPLSGADLVRRKVKLLACAGGAFPKGDEFNFRSSGDDSAFVVVNGWPGRVMYVGFDVGQAIYTAGRLPEAASPNPIRRVYVDIKRQFPYPAWGQIMVCYAVRGNPGLWGVEDKGSCHADRAGGDWWSADPDPSGDQDQGYLLEKVRTPVRDMIDALIMLPPNDGKPSKPGWPSGLRASVAGGTVELRWTDNAYNESGFKIERRENGAYREVASVGANATSWTDTAPPATANASYRVKAWNATGESGCTTAWIYSGWTEVDLGRPGDLPLYAIEQSANLRWRRGGDFRPEHVALNDDSQHGKAVAIDADVGALGAEGEFHVYLLWQDQDNWYRLSADGRASRFEKRIAGTTTAIGSPGPGVNLGDGARLQAWHVASTAAGGLSFAIDGKTVLEASEPLVLEKGRIGLGGKARTPVWENVRFASGR